MREISVLDGLVYLGTVAWSLPLSIPPHKLLYLVLQVLVRLPFVVYEVITSTLGIGRPRDAHHYANVANPLQQLIIRLAGLAFDRVDYLIGRQFLNSTNCLCFARWRLGNDLARLSRTITIPARKHCPSTMVYEIFDGQPRREQVRQVILYAHGGGFVVGSVPFYLEFLIALQGLCTDTLVLAPEYNLVPETTYPVQVEQVMATYHYIKLQYPEARVVFGGDSAGCALLQTVLLRLSRGQTTNANTVHKVFYISPWLDLAAKYLRTTGGGDFISVETIARYGQWYSTSGYGAGTVLADERAPISPNPLMNTDDQLKSSVPAGGMLILCGGAECLKLDTEIFQAIVDGFDQEEKVRVQVHIEANEIHAYVLTNLYLRRGAARLSGLHRIVNYLGTPD